jgi:putative tryptophan/tyrosine transport system substrate-binding protein
MLLGGFVPLLLLLCLLLPTRLVNAGQPTPPQRIGVIDTGFFPNTPFLKGLKEGLKAHGIEEGRDVTFDVRPIRGNLDQAPGAAASLVAAGVDIIITGEGEHVARAAKVTTRTLPIVFVGVGDPVAGGLVSSIARPGGNVTGVSSMATELTPKRLEILKAMHPGIRRVWAVYHAEDLSSAAATRKAEETAASLKLELVARAVRTPEELVGKLKGLRPGDGLLAPPQVTMNIPGLILDLQRMDRWPAVFNQTFWVEAGALVSYGPNMGVDGAQAGRLAARILRGQRPQDLPVEGSNRVELAINLKTARSLGITIPPEVLVRADRVIQ